MEFLALATDYDGTLAKDGVVRPETVAALERLRASGRKLLMVTGRVLPELKTVFPRLDLFDRVVVENGALLYRPKSDEELLVADPPEPAFVRDLQRRGIPFGTGRSIVASVVPHEVEMLKSIHELGLELQVIFNKESVMVLPTGVNKWTGLTRVLDELGIKPSQVVGVGDAENDHAFLKACGVSVAVANAVPSLKEECQLVMSRPRGEGVEELIEMWLRDEKTLTTEDTEDTEVRKTG